MSPRLSALLQEVEEIRKGIEATRSAIFTIFGVVVPAFVSVVLITNEKGLGLMFGKESLPIFVVALASLGTMWSQFLWMEYFRHVRYYYIELLPRVYAASEQGNRLNMLEWDITNRSVLHWVPLGLFNLCCSLVMIVLYYVYVSESGNTQVKLLCLILLLAGALSVLAVLAEVYSIRREVRERNVHAVP